ncbi:hypothetical protein GJV06_01900 [Enterobacteriaceae bacterium RIT691]|nr:hypothetical protein [Enterobacteriaceae bacterium RIT691]
MKNKISMVVPAILLTACATQHPSEKISSTKDIPVNGTDHVALRVASTINSAADNSQEVLNVVSRSDTAMAAGLTVLQAGLTIFGGGGQAVSGFSKEDLKGSNIDSVANPSGTDLEGGLVALVKAVDLKPEAAGKAVKVKQRGFKLMYDGLDEDNYSFIYDTDITFNTDTSKGNYTYRCSSTALMNVDTHKTYAQWSKDNYAEVKAVAQKVADKCVTELQTPENKSKVAQALNGELKQPVT